MSFPALMSRRRTGHALAAGLLLCLAGLLPAGPAAAAIVNYSIANPAANGWTGGTITVGSLDDTLPTLPSLITALIGGSPVSFVPDTYAPQSDLFHLLKTLSPTGSLYFASAAFGAMTSTPTTTWRDITTTNGGTYAMLSGNFFYFTEETSGANVAYLDGTDFGTSVTFSADSPVPVPAPFALLLAAAPVLWLQRRRPRNGHPA